MYSRFLFVLHSEVDSSLFPGEEQGEVGEVGLRGLSLPFLSFL